MSDVRRETSNADDARAQVLARIRAALGEARAQEAAEQAPRYRRASELDAAARDELFASRAADYRATVRRAAPDQVETAVAAALADHGARRVVVPEGLDPAWVPAGLDAVVDAGLNPAELDELDGVLTGAALAIAETGTIVLDGGPGQGRRALTLVPDLHVCVVELEGIVGSVPEAIAALEDGAREHGRPLTLISGPSATSDIELNRVEGVHGPRRLEVVLAG